MSEFFRFSLRIPTELHENLKTLADQDMRSLNNYIILALENHVKINKNYPLYKYMSDDEIDMVAESSSVEDKNKVRIKVTRPDKN